jgi:hypothetical protein
MHSENEERLCGNSIEQLIEMVEGVLRSHFRRVAKSTVLSGNVNYLCKVVHD